jgi:hypothetical protein
MADPKAPLNQLLFDALIEIRQEAREGRADTVFRIADLFHRLPLQLERMERGEVTHEEVMSQRPPAKARGLVSRLHRTSA